MVQNKGIVKKCLRALRLAYYYLRAKFILLYHYDKPKFIGGRWFHGGKYGAFTASGWKLVVDDYISCKKAHVNNHVMWPVSPQIRIINPENIFFDPDDLNNFQGFGNYYQAIGKISIGGGTYIAPNVGIITSNHDLDNLDNHLPPKDVVIGKECWLGMNSVILPGVTLGDHTVVGAGSVVTNSFPEGNCVIAGNPAKVIKHLRK